VVRIGCLAMKVLLYIPIVLSLFVFAAHFLRSGFWPLTLGMLFLPVLLGLRQPWVARLVQIVLIIAGLEWVRTLFNLTMWRSRQGEPSLRMAVILGIVAAVAIGASLLFQGKTLKRIYRLERSGISEESADDETVVR
jgi:cytochrome c biogenesis protein CcdA